MLPHFPTGTRNWEIGSKRKGKRRKEEFLKEKCNQVTNGIEPLPATAKNLMANTVAEKIPSQIGYMTRTQLNSSGFNNIADTNLFLFM